MAISAFLILLALAAGFFIYQEKQNTLISSRFSLVYSRLNTWMNERKTRLDRNLAQAKQLAANTRNTHQEIHFEFYSALPNMRISVPENEEIPRKKMLGMTTVPATPAPAPVPNIRPVIAMNHPQLPDHIDKAQTLFDSAQLQRALKNEFLHAPVKQAPVHQYVLQLGIFKNAAGAEKFRSSFAKSGYSARVVKFAIAKGIAYSVQAGPFTSKNQALLTQRQLQKKNVNSILRKLES